MKRRGLYDFVSICAVFGICQRSSSNIIEWFGLDRASDAIDILRAEVHSDDRKTTLRGLFNYSADPSLPKISIAVVKLFFYMSVKSLDLRKVGKFFAQGNTKYKTMVRKLYTVAAGLEIAQIVRKTAVVSEIRLNAPLHLAGSDSQLGVAFVLNTRKELEDKVGYERRRKEFEDACLLRNQPSAFCPTLHPPPAVRPWFNALYM
jgi:hypothetical protein